MAIESGSAHQNIHALNSQKPNKLRVAFIIPGGVGTGNQNIGVPILQELIKSLSRNVDLTVFSLFKVNDDYRPQGFTLKSIQHRYIFTKSAILLWYFWRDHRHRSFDIVHGCWALPSGFLAVIIGKIFRIKSVVTILGGDAASLPAIQYGQLRNKIQRMFVLWTLHQADEPTSLTQFSVNNLLKAGLHKSMKVIPWGVDIDQFVLKKKQLSTPLQFLHVANLVPVKDQATLLRAFKLINNQIPSILTIIGEGTAEPEIRSLAASLALDNSIRFLGLLPHDNLPSYYHQSDILLQTSLSEGQGVVVTEAMSCGVLVCGTRIGVMADIPQACITVDVGDYRSLADQVIHLLKDEVRMNEIRERAHEWTQAHSMRWTVAKTIQMYSTLTKR